MGASHTRPGSCRTPRDNLGKKRAVDNTYARWQGIGTASGHTVTGPTRLAVVDEVAYRETHGARPGTGGGAGEVRAVVQSVLDREKAQPPVRARRRRRKAPRARTIAERLDALRDSRWGDVLLAVALFGVALAIRWPYLLRLPHFTDETVEIDWALRIWRGEILPLTASDRYYGPLHPYIVAGCLWLFGPSIALPRAIVMVFGALTVALTYLLGRVVVGRGVGVLAAGLLATAPQHILVNSHIAWQNATTPFYATLTFLALSRYLNTGLAPARPGVAARAAPRWPAGGWLILAGVAYGLTLHTHPGTIVLAPALALAFVTAVWRARAWHVVRTRWLWLAPLAGLLAYSPVLLYNLTNNLAGVRRVQTRRSYAYETALSWEKYRQNMGDLWLELLRMISNPMRIPEVRWHYLTSPHLLLLIGSCALGIGLLIRRGPTLPAWALLSTSLLLPAFNRAYGQTWDRYMLTGRYVTFLLPLAYLAVATALLFLVERLLRALPTRWRQPRPTLLALGVAAALLALLVAYPLRPLSRYYTHEAAKDPANASFLATVAFVRARHEPHVPVIIGRMLASIDLKDGTNAREVFAMLLDLDRIPHISPRNTSVEIARFTAASTPGQPATLPLIIMMRDECHRLGGALPFYRVSERYQLRELYWALPSYYAVYQPTPDGGPGGCEPEPGSPLAR